MQHVSLTSSDGVAVLAIDRPPANAMDLDLLSSIVTAVETIAADPPAAVVVTGREEFFSGGVDLKAVPMYGPTEQRRMVEAINAMAMGVYSLPCPVVGAITGHAIAGGLVLSLCADVRVASHKGRYGLTEAKVAVPYPQAAIAVVRAELAPHAARLLALGNQLVDAAECRRLGVFDEVVEPEMVLPRACALAAELAGFSADAYRRTKRDLRGRALELMRVAVAGDPLLDGWVTLESQRP